MYKRQPRNLSIVSVALGLGYGIGANPAILAGSPQMVSLIFGGSGIVAAAAVAIVSVSYTHLECLPMWCSSPLGKTSRARRLKRRACRQIAPTSRRMTA